MEHEIEKELQEDLERKKRLLGEKEILNKDANKTGEKELPKSYDEIDAEIEKKFMKAAKILERMVNQNIYDQVIKGDSNREMYCYIVEKSIR